MESMFQAASSSQPENVETDHLYVKGTREAKCRIMVETLTVKGNTVPYIVRLW